MVVSHAHAPGIQSVKGARTVPHPDRPPIGPKRRSGGHLPTRIYIGGKALYLPNLTKWSHSSSVMKFSNVTTHGPTAGGWCEVECALYGHGGTGLGLEWITGKYCGMVPCSNSLYLFFGGASKTIRLNMRSRSPGPKMFSACCPPPSPMFPTCCSPRSRSP